MFIQGLEQAQQPTLRRELVVVNKGDEVAMGIFDRFVACQRDILSALYAILHREGRDGCEFRHNRLGRPQTVVVNNDERIREELTCDLARELLQQAFEELRPLVSANAHTNVLVFSYQGV